MLILGISQQECEQDNITKVNYFFLSSDLHINVVKCSEMDIYIHTDTIFIPQCPFLYILHQQNT